MAKRLEPMMGVPAKEYLRMIKENAPLAGQSDSAEVEDQRRDVADLVNIDVCMNEDQVRWVRDKLFLGGEKENEAEALAWVPVVNSFRLDCRNCLREACPQRDLGAPLRKVKERSQNSSLKVDDVAFSVRAANTIASINIRRPETDQIRTIQDVSSLTVYDLLEERNCGFKTINEIKKVLAGFGLELRDRENASSDHHSTYESLMSERKQQKETLERIGMMSVVEFFGELPDGMTERMRRVTLASMQSEYGNIRTLNDLCSKSPRQLLQLKDIGPRTVKLIESALAKQGLSLFLRRVRLTNSHSE
jgi:hypothetical protein